MHIKEKEIDEERRLVDREKAEKNSMYKGPEAGKVWWVGGTRRRLD